MLHHFFVDIINNKIIEFENKKKCINRHNSKESTRRGNKEHGLSTVLSRYTTG